MLMLPSGVRVYVANFAINMNKSFTGLSAIVSSDFKQDVCSGNLFAFFNKKCDRVKILYWDGNGFGLWYKQLQKGRFNLPRIQNKHYKLTVAELNLLLEGIDLTSKARLRAA